jgi:ribose 5-phosphate isomerase A
VASLGLDPVLRVGDNGKPFVSDGGHYILDCATDGIADPATFGALLKAITGVVDHGLFVGMTSLALTIDAGGTIVEHVRS